MQWRWPLLLVELGKASVCRTAGVTESLVCTGPWHHTDLQSVSC